jgi:hypothetical protein
VLTLDQFIGQSFVLSNGSLELPSTDAAIFTLLVSLHEHRAQAERDAATHPAATMIVENCTATYRWLAVRYPAAIRRIAKALTNRASQA